MMVVMLTAVCICGHSTHDHAPDDAGECMIPACMGCFGFFEAPPPVDEVEVLDLAV